MLPSLENRSRVVWWKDSVDGKVRHGVGFLRTKKRINMNNALSSIIEYFKSHEWNFTQDADRPLLRTGFSGENGEWRCVAVLEREEKQFTFLSFFPCKAPAKLRRSCAELITRINFRLSTGSFQMDWDDGEILMKTTMFIPSEGLSSEIIDPVVDLNLPTMDFFFPAFIKVLYAGAKPEDALHQLEEPEKVRPRFELN